MAQVPPKSIFYVPRLVEAARHQPLDSLLGGGTPERRDARIPPGAQLDVRGRPAFRALPDIELDAFVEALATRIAKFDKWAIARTKRLVK